MAPVEKLRTLLQDSSVRVGDTSMYPAPFCKPSMEHCQADSRMAKAWNITYDAVSNVTEQKSCAGRRSKKETIMLESSLFESRPDRDGIGSRKKPATLAMSTVVHVMIASGLILIQLLQTHAVPPVALPPPVVSPGAPVRMIKLAATPLSGRTAARSLPQPLPDALTVPASVPDKVPYVVDAIDISSLESLNTGLSAGPAGPRGPSNLIGLLIPAAPPVAAPPPRPPDPATPPPAPKIEIRAPLRVASSLQVSRLIKKVDPEYPILARRGHIEATVVAEARITGSGTVDSLRIISGNSLFYTSVLDALKQWRYEPTLLNGEPIDVITTITVNFRLN
jgi:protein TonB